ncbi:hypothetical protein IW262DRAFT_978213 [Armillaria fumosa]|nr:hypothetical protein IW262DRAFT_978213 [Armillaria fumosa]
MDQNYYAYSQPAQSYAPLVNSYGALMQPYYNTEYPIPPGMYTSARDNRTRASFSPVPSYGSAYTISNGSNVLDFSEAQRSPFPNVHLGNTVLTYSPAFPTINPDTSDAGDSTLISYSESRSQSSALVPYTASPTASSTVPSGTNVNRGSAQRQRTRRNRAPSTTSTSCSTRSSISSTSPSASSPRSSTRSHRSTDVVHILTGGVNVYIIYLRR